MDVLYENKGRKYTVIKWGAVMKHPETRKWTEVVVYKALTKPLVWFVREKKEFQEKFKVVET